MPWTVSVRVLVEVSDQTIDREVVVLANGDQCGRGDECRDLARDQFAAAHIKADCVRRQEVVMPVAVELGPLAARCRVLDGE